MIKISRFPTRIYELDFEKDILVAEQKLINEYGFLKEEINFIMKYKPSFILFEQDSQKTGLKSLVNYLVEERGFDMDVVRTLTVKYPYILSKEESDLRNYFEILTRHGLTEKEIIKALIECPKLISRNLEHQMKEIHFLFNLYHGMKDNDVLEIFRSFPYLYCCDLKKI